jgi:hypothetical protein
MTFRGTSLFGTAATTRRSFGPVRQRAIQTTAPGVHGGGVHLLGREIERINVEVSLLENDDAAMTSRESTIRAEIENGLVGDLVDDWGETTNNCLLESWTPRGPREVISSDGSLTRLQRGTAVFLRLA